MQNICLVTTQSFKRGKSGRKNMETFAFISAVHGYHVYQEVLTPSIGQKLVAKREFSNTMDKQAVKVVMPAMKQSAICLASFPISVVFSCT